MEKFLLIVKQDVQRLALLTKEEMNANIREMTMWVEELAQSGNYVNGEPLMNIGRYVSRDQVLSDGPFIEAKEAISGYITIAAENIDQAASIAQTCPKVIKNELILEVRPILVMDKEVRPSMYEET
jgi:hypothetical protein